MPKVSGSPVESSIGRVYVDPSHLAKLEFLARGLSFVAPAPLSSILSGNHASRLRGRGLNFEEIRSYLPGDDVRHIDWKVSLRLGKAQVRAYTEERDRPMLVVVDQRMSMFFGSSRAFKSVVAAEVVALAVWMGFAAGDRVGSTRAITTTISIIDKIPYRQPRPTLAKNCGPPVNPSAKINSAKAMFFMSGEIRAPLWPRTRATISVPQTPPNCTGPSLNEPIRKPSARLANKAISGCALSKLQSMIWLDRVEGLAH